MEVVETQQKLEGMRSVPILSENTAKNGLKTLRVNSPLTIYVQLPVAVIFPINK